MSTVSIRFPEDKALEVAISEFITEEFKQNCKLENEAVSNEPHKDMSYIDAVYQVMTFIAVVEGVLQFKDRAFRMERVKTLMRAINKSGKSVYLKIHQQEAVDLSKKSVNEVMDLLPKVKKDEDS